MRVDRRLIVAIAVGLALSALAEVLLVEHRERLFAWSDLPLFWTGFGFAGCIAIVVASKWAGHTFLMRHDDPYTGEHVEAETEEEAGDG